jgi:hypothetical protein
VYHTGALLKTAARRKVMGKNDVVFLSNGVQYVYSLLSKNVYRLVKEDVTSNMPEDVATYVDVIEQTLEKVIEKR